MAVLDKIPDLYYPTLMVDIRDTLNANGGNVSNDLTSFFKESAGINMWSVRKPVYDASTGVLTTEQMATAGRSYAGFTARYGLNIVGGKGITPNNIYQNATLLGSGIFYRLPKGGLVSPYRLSDFNGYYPQASQPLRGAYSGTVTINPLVGDDSFAFEHFRQVQNQAGYELGFEDLYQSKDEDGNPISWRSGLVLVNEADNSEMRLLLDAIDGAFTRTHKGKTFNCVQFITSLPASSFPPSANDQRWTSYWQYAIPDGSFKLKIRNTTDTSGNTGVQTSIKVDVATGYPKFTGIITAPYTDVMMKFTIRIVGGNGNISNFTVGLYPDESCSLNNRISFEAYSDIIGLTGSRVFTTRLSNPQSLTDVYVGIRFNGNLQNVNKVQMPISLPEID